MLRLMAVGMWIDVNSKVDLCVFFMSWKMHMHLGGVRTVLEETAAQFSKHNEAELLLSCLLLWRMLLATESGWQMLEGLEPSCEDHLSSYQEEGRRCGLQQAVQMWCASVDSTSARFFLSMWRMWTVHSKDVIEERRVWEEHVNNLYGDQREQAESRRFALRNGMDKLFFAWALEADRTCLSTVLRLWSKHCHLLMRGDTERHKCARAVELTARSGERQLRDELLQSCTNTWQLHAHAAATISRAEHDFRHRCEEQIQRLQLQHAQEMEDVHRQCAEELARVQEADGAGHAGAMDHDDEAWMDAMQRLVDDLQRENLALHSAIVLHE